MRPLRAPQPPPLPLSPRSPPPPLALTLPRATPNCSRLLYGGAQCLDATTLEQANVKAGDTLHMVLALRGGAF